MATPLDDAPVTLIEEARQAVRAERQAEAHEAQGRRLAHRLFVAFVLIAVVGVVSFVALPITLGVSLPPILPLAAFGLILAAAVLNHRAEAPDEPEADGSETKAMARHAGREDEGRPFGCCPGPGTLRCFRD